MRTLLFAILILSVEFGNARANCVIEEEIMRILVCDDELEERNAISSLLMDCKYKQGCSLRGLHDPFMVLEYFEDGYEADIVFLDILMPIMSGIDLAQKLRASGYEGFIVFLSSVNCYAVESYGVKAFAYLLKPSNKSEVQALLDKIEKTRTSVKASGIKLILKDGSRFIKFADLIFVEVKNHNLFFHLNNGEIIKIYGKLIDYSEALLADPRMSQDNRSFIFNMDYIHRCEDGAVYLKDGTRISIPNGFSEFQNNYFKWMFGKDEERL